MNEQVSNRIENKLDRMADDMKTLAVQMAQVHERITKIDAVETEMQAHIEKTKEALAPIQHHVKLVGYLLRASTWLLGASLTSAIAYAFSLFAK